MFVRNFLQSPLGKEVGSEMKKGAKIGVAIGLVGGTSVAIASGAYLNYLGAIIAGNFIIINR